MSLTKIDNAVLANTTVVSGTYGGSTIVPVSTVDAQGRITFASNVNIDFSVATVSASAAYNQANNATTLAQSAFDSANNIPPQIQAAFDQANVAPFAYARANGAFIQANAAFDLANTKYSSSGGTISGDVFITGNTTPTTDNVYTLGTASNRWKSIYVGPGTIYVGDASLGTTSGKLVVAGAGDISLPDSSAPSFAETANIAKASFTQANAATESATFGYARANSAYTQANAATESATFGYARANSSYAQANAATESATFGYERANSAYVQANAATESASSGYARANSAFVQANAATESATFGYSRANSAFVQANAATESAASGYARANSAYVQANAAIESAQAAYNAANAGYTIVNTGGTITGNLTVTKDLSVTGNLYVLGNTTTINTSSFSVQDSMIILGIGNYTTDLVDIGFAGHYNAGTNAHAGIIRDASEKEFYIFDNYTPELSSNNNIDINDPSFRKANINAGVFKGNLIASTATVNGYNIFNYSSASYAQANAATDSAQAAYNQANTNTTSITAVNSFAQGAYNTANTNATNITAVNNFAQGAYNQANTNTTSITAVNNYATGAYNAANTNATNITAVNNFAAGAYNQANTNTTNITAVNNFAAGAYNQANTNSTSVTAVNNFAQGAYNQANTNTTSITAVNNFAQGAYNRANVGSNLVNTGGTISGNLTISGSITPSANVTYNLGSDSFRFKDLYITDNGLHIGNALVNAVGTTVNLPAGSTVNGTPIGSGGGGSAIAIYDEGTLLTSAVASLDFTGLGVAVTNVGNTVTVTVTGGVSNNSVATSGNITPNANTTSQLNLNGLTGNIVFLIPTGTPVDGQKLMFRIKDDGVSTRTLTWTTTGTGCFREVGVTLPTSTTLNKTTYVGSIYNSTDLRWDVVAVAVQA